MINGKEKLIVAIDTDDFDKAKELILLSYNFPPMRFQSL